MNRFQKILSEFIKYSIKLNFYPKNYNVSYSSTLSLSSFKYCAPLLSHSSLPPPPPSPSSRIWYLLAISIPFFKRSEDEQRKNEQSNEADLQQQDLASQVKNFMALAMREIEAGQSQEADARLHKILGILEEMCARGEITERERRSKAAHVYATLANLYLMGGRHDLAKPLIKQTIATCLEHGGAEMPDDHPAVIELSLKLSMLLARELRNLVLSGGDEEAATEKQRQQTIADKFTEADLGFRFCIDKAESALKKAQLQSDEDEIVNCTALLGMAHNYYSTFLHQNSRPAAALEHTVKARQLSVQLYTEQSINSINLLNDTALLQLELGQLDAANRNINQAIRDCQANPSQENVSMLVVFYANLTSILIGQRRPTEAFESCQTAKRLLEQQKKAWKNQNQSKTKQTANLTTSISSGKTEHLLSESQLRELSEQIDSYFEQITDIKGFVLDEQD